MTVDTEGDESDDSEIIMTGTVTMSVKVHKPPLILERDA